MGQLTIRDLRNHGGDVVDGAERGETITVTRSGKPVVELRALPAPSPAIEVLLARHRYLPRLDPAVAAVGTETRRSPDQLRDHTIDRCVPLA